MTKPDFENEELLWNAGYSLVAGVDEVGRGCFAGPLVAAAVILPPEFLDKDEVNDSKLLSPKKRLDLSVKIKDQAVCYSLAEVSVEIINKIGIAEATQYAFYQAVNDLKKSPDYILIDAFYIKRIDKNKQKPIVHGDRKSISIAAASIIAKVYRDGLMQEFALQYPLYDFSTNKGYGTDKHREAIKSFGLSDLHRKCFNLAKYT